MNAKQKGARGEREWAEYLREQGVEARRGQQFCGTPDSPDVISSMPIHWEVKRVEALNVPQAMARAVQDAGTDKPAAMAHRRNRGDWLITMRAADLLPVLIRYLRENERRIHSPLDQTEREMGGVGAAGISHQPLEHCVPAIDENSE